MEPRTFRDMGTIIRIASPNPNDRQIFQGCNGSSSHGVAACLDTRCAEQAQAYRARADERFCRGVANETPRRGSMIECVPALEWDNECEAPPEAVSTLTGSVSVPEVCDAVLVHPTDRRPGRDGDHDRRLRALPRVCDGNSVLRR